MAVRKQISKRVRFEVLKRDAFTCQYCGKSAPDVILHIDHIKPVSKGGNNGILNLVTSCQSCNSGKSNVELSDDSSLRKQQKQLADLAEKNAQIKMMVEWRDEIENSEDLLVDSAVRIIAKLLVDCSPNDHGRMLIRKAIKKHGFVAVIESIHKSYEISDSIDDFKKKWAKGFGYIGKRQDEKSKSINYIKGILRNRFNHFNERGFYSNLSKVNLTDRDMEELTKEAKRCDSVSNFYDFMEDLDNG